MNMQNFKEFTAELDEAVSVEHDRYVRSHGKKASGSGTWMFTHKRAGAVDYKNEKHVHQATGSFSDAKKSAKEWGKSHGHSTVYVMEEIDIDEARMSAALRMANAIDKQRAKSDASRARTPSSIPKKEEPKKQGVAEASDRMQRYGQLILKRKAEQNAAAQAAKPQPKKEEPPASSDYDSMSTRDFMKQLRDQRRPKKKGVAEAFRPMDEPRYDLSIEARQKRADNAAKAKKEEPKKQGVAEGATGAKPGFMLRQDPDLAKKLKDQLARKKKLPQGADFAAQRRKERLASNGRMDEDNEHYDKAEEHLSKANDAESKGHMKSFHAHMADHHDAMSEWHDSKGRSASADKHADKAEMHHEKSLTVKEDIDLNEDRIPKNHTIEAHGIRGMKATPWRKTFKNHEHLSDWADKNDSVEVHATRDLDGVKKKTNEELSFTLSFKEFIEEESPSD